jgi:hypothetical protein
MVEDAEDAVLRLLTDRAPNSVSELVIRQRLPAFGAETLSEALDHLAGTERVEMQPDPRPGLDRPINYYRLKSYQNLPIRHTIKVGDQEIPRVLSVSSPRFLPEDLNEQIERLAEYTDTLEKRFADLVKEEQRGYWANVVTIFGVFVSLLTLIIVGLPKITTDPSLPFWQVVELNFAQLLPVASILAAFVLLLRVLIR